MAVWRVPPFVGTYERRTYVNAPLETVWSFHSSIDGFEAIAPAFANLRTEVVRGPTGTRDPAVLESGSEFVVSVKPFGLGPRQRATVRIVDRHREDGRALFRDELSGTPFSRWVHTHHFEASGEGTVVTDRIEFELPGGALAELLSPVVRVGLELAFRDRHRRIRERLGA